MPSPDRNKGNLQYLAGEFLHQFGFALLQSQGDTEVWDKGVYGLDILTYPVSRKDEKWMAEFDAIDNDQTPRLTVRSRQMREMAAKLYDAGILSDKGVPFYDETEGEDE